MGEVKYSSVSNCGEGPRFWVTFLSIRDQYFIKYNEDIAALSYCLLTFYT